MADMRLGVSVCAMRNTILAHLISIDCALQCLCVCKRTQLIHIALVCWVTVEGRLRG